jgi:tripartite-type tricarboxylate transporter receptor subunit TctC
MKSIYSAWNLLAGTSHGNEWSEAASIASRKKRALAALALASVVSTPLLAVAAYPERPIEVVISFPPAGATDALARAVSQELAKELGQSLVVQNRPGAGGSIGLAAAARSAPNGYTLYFAATTNQAIGAAIYPDQPASLLDDFVPIGQVGYAPHALVVPTSLPISSVSDLLAFLKAGPGEYNYASQGTGTLSHLESEIFTSKNQLEVMHIPYKGSVQALPDVANATAAFMFDSVTGSMPLVQAGKIRYLAVASEARVTMLPDVPTLAEAGVDNVVANNVFGFFAPKGTPSEVIDRLSATLERVAADPELRTRLAKQGSELKYAPASEFAKTVATEHEYWGGVVKAANVVAK